MNPNRLLLFGGAGQLGTEFRRRGSSEISMFVPSHEELDVADTEAVAATLDGVSPRVVVNCAAFHNVDRCEEEPERAFETNALAVGRVAELCAERGITFVTISTDYVFDGELGRPYVESDPPRPLNAYGVSKYAGELLVERLQSHAYVIRTCGVYGTRVSSSKGYTFIDRIIKQARAGEPIRVVDDQIVSPTYAGHLAERILALLQSEAPYGVYHVVNEGTVTWYDFACEALRQAGIDHPIEPVAAATWNAKARRPRFSALANAGLQAQGLSMPGWREGIAAYLRDVTSSQRLDV